MGIKLFSTSPRRIAFIIVVGFVLFLGIKGFFSSTFFILSTPQEKEVPSDKSNLLNSNQLQGGVKTYTKPSTSWQGVVDSNTGLMFSFPPDLSIEQSASTIILREPSESSTLPPSFVVYPFKVSSELTTLSPEAATARIATERLGPDLIRTVNTKNGGLEVEATTLLFHHFFLYVPALNAAVEFATGRDDFFASDEFSLIVNHVKNSANWLDFEEPKGRYSIKIPPDGRLQYSENEHLLTVRFSSYPVATEAPGLYIAVDPNPNHLAMTDYYDGTPGIDLMGQSANKFSGITVNGVNAFRFIPFITLSGDVVVVVSTGEEFLRITDHGSALQRDGLFDLILQTVRLAKADSANSKIKSSVITWTSFQDTANGIRLAFPSLGLGSKVEVRPIDLKGTKSDMLDIQYQAPGQAIFVSTFGIFVLPNPVPLSLDDWFHKNVDPTGVLVQTKAFTTRKLTNGMDALVLSGIIPSDYLEEFGPVMSMYAISLSGKHIIIIGISQINELDLLGVSQTEAEEILSEMLERSTFP